MHRSRLLIACAFALAAGLVASAAWRGPTRATPTLDPAAVPSQDRAPARPLDPADAAPPAALGEAETPGKASAPGDGVARERTPRNTASYKASVAAPAPGAAGRIVAIDPETGEVAPPTEEQLRELTAPGTELESADQNVQMVHRPDGIVLMVVGPRIQDYSFVQMAPDGKLVYGCGPVSEKPGTQAALPAPAPTLEER